MRVESYPFCCPWFFQTIACVNKVALSDQLFYTVSTLNSQLSTLNSQLSTLNSQLSTLNSQLSTLNSQLFSSRQSAPFRAFLNGGSPLEASIRAFLMSDPLFDPHYNQYKRACNPINPPLRVERFAARPAGVNRPIDENCISPDGHVILRSGKNGGIFARRFSPKWANVDGSFSVPLCRRQSA